MKIHKILTASFFGVVLVSVAGADTVECWVDDTVTRDQLPVPVRVLEGAGAGASEPVDFKGEKFSATWQKGDQYDRQMYLRMEFGQIRSQIYNFSTTGAGPLNVIDQGSAGNLRFQCWMR